MNLPTRLPRALAPAALLVVVGAGVLGFGPGRGPRALGAAADAAQPALREAYHLAATWTGEGTQSAPGSLYDPAGIELSGGLLYVVDRGNDRIGKFRPEDDFVAAWGRPGDGDGELDRPQDVAVAGSRVFVSDRGNGRVAVFTTDGAFVANWQVPGLDGPWGVAASGARVYVSQPETGEVFALVDGAVAARWGGLADPRGVAVGPDGRVYVAERGGGAVSIFAPDGTPAGAVAMTARNDPTDVAVDERGDLFVLTDRAILWYEAGSSNSRLGMYFGGLQGVTVSSSHGVFASVSSETTAVSVVRYPWHPQEGNTIARWERRSFPPGRLYGPHGLFVGPDGLLWVLDGWPRVQAFGTDGAARHQADLAPYAEPAVDLAVLADGDVLVGEARWLRRYERQGGAPQWSVRLSAGMNKFWLTALALSSAGDRVSVLDSAFAHARDYGLTGEITPTNSWPLAGLSDPSGWQLYWDVALAGQGPAEKAYVVNRGAHVVEVYEGGARRATWPIEGVAARAAVGPDGALFVLTAEGIVWKLDGSGTPLAGWDASGFSAGASRVVDLAVDAAGRVYTADQAANTIRVWERDPQGTLEPPVVRSAGCRLRRDKRAEPATVRLGEPVTVRLEVGGDCPNTAPESDIVVAIDRSFSMNANNKITDTRRAAIAFLRSMDLTRDRVAVATFDSTARIIQPLTSDLAAAEAAVAGITAIGSTNVAAAIDTSAAELFGAGGRPGVKPVIILLTDGRDPVPDAALAAARAAKAREARIFTIGFGDVDHMVMALAAEVPEDYFYAPDSTTLTDIYAEIAKRISATVLAATITIVDELPANMRYLGPVGLPAPTVQGRTLTWTLADVPFSGLALAYRVEPTALGDHPTNVEATADFVDGLGQPGDLRFPVPVVRVVAVAPTPTATSTPFPTRTPTPVPPKALFLPVVLKQSCDDRTVHADVVLVIDTSGSMQDPSGVGTETKLQAAVGAARTFVGALHLPDDRAGIVSFNTNAVLVQPLTGDRELLLAQLDRLQSEAGTRIDRGLDVAVTELTGPGRVAANTGVIVLLTDGRSDDVEDAVVLLAARRAREAGLRTFTIGLGADVDPVILRQIATTPSDYYAAPSAGDLASIYAQIAYTIECVGLDWP